MKKIILAVLLTIVYVGVSFAAVEVQEDGTTVTKSEKLNFENGPNVSKNGTVTDVDFQHIVISPVRYTSNPCATIGTGTIFFNNSTSVPCYCNGSNDYAIYSATTRCF